MATVMQWDFNLRKPVPLELHDDREVTAGGLSLGPGVWTEELIPGVHNEARQVIVHITVPVGSRVSKQVEKMG